MKTTEAIKIAIECIKEEMDFTGSERRKHLTEAIEELERLLIIDDNWIRIVKEELDKE